MGCKALRQFTSYGPAEFPGGSAGKESSCNAGDLVWSLGQEDPLKKEVTTHSSILAWRIPWTEEPGGLQSMGSQRVRHDWATNTFTHSISVETSYAVIWIEDSQLSIQATESLFSVSLFLFGRQVHLYYLFSDSTYKGWSTTFLLLALVLY